MTVKNNNPYTLKRTHSKAKYGSFRRVALKMKRLMTSKRNLSWQKTVDIMEYMLLNKHMSFRDFMKDNFVMNGKPNLRKGHEVHNRNQIFKAYFYNYSSNKWKSIIKHLFEQLYGNLDLIPKFFKHMQEVRIAKRKARDRKIHQEKLRKIYLHKLAKKRFLKEASPILMDKGHTCKKQAENELSIINEALDK